MRIFLPLFLVVALLVAFPTLVQAEDQPVTGGADQGSGGTGAGDMEGMEMGGSGGGSPGDPDYKPIEHRADDGSMARVTAMVFGFPVVIWLVIRSLRKSMRSRGTES